MYRINSRLKQANTNSNAKIDYNIKITRCKDCKNIIINLDKNKRQYCKYKEIYVMKNDIACENFK